MSDKKPYHKKNQHPTDKTVSLFTILSKPLILSILTFVPLSLLFSLLIYQRYELIKEKKRKEAYEIISKVKDKLQETLTMSLSATKTLTFFIDKNGQVNNFDSVAAQILESAKDIDAIELVPGGVIEYVYPLKGNEKLIGYNILNDPLRSEEAYKAIEKKEMVFAGPFELRQGGVGVVGRLPVFRNNKFWGFSAVVVKMADLLKTAGIDSAGENGHYFQLSKIHPGTKKEDFFLPQLQSLTNNQSVSVNVPNGEWKLSVTSATASRDFADIALLAILGFLFSVLGAVFVYRFATQPQKLNELVINRTRELKTSENNYRSLIERVSDAFVAIDKDWVFTYVNERAGEIFDKDPQSLIGKNIWDEFPEGADQPFHRACYRAMEKQEYQYLEEYDTTFNKWLENHIYPSKDGLTVFFKDVTDIKQIALALKENEEKYRSLIEQASDGIVITDLEGIILEVNNSMKRMIGTEDEELIGYHVTDYIPDEDMKLMPLRINELMQGKSLLYERRLLKKDGTMLEVEINSKMASSHTLIGFVRDIAERKKHENTLRYQARLLQSVSDAITSLDIDRRIVSWNRTCEELYGFSHEEVIGKRIPELVSFEFPGSTNEQVFEKIYKEGQWKGEFNFTHPKTNLCVHLLSSINVLKNNDGEINGFIITSKDITERKKAEAENKKSNERFELIAEATNDAVWDHDFGENETWGNNKLYSFYGFKPGEQKINFEMFLERIHPDESQGISERLKLAVKNRAVSLSEVFRFRTATGEYKTFYDRSYIKYDDAGNPLRMLGAMQDITDREIIKQQIIKEKELSDTLINSLPGIFYLYTKHGKFVRWNKNFEKVTGYTGEEISKMQPLDFYDKKDQGLMAEKIANVFHAGNDNVEADLFLKSKEKIPYYFTGQAIEYEGEICLMGVGLDFSEREKAEQQLKENEERLRLSLQAAKQGLYDVNVQTGDAVVNEQYAEMLGYDPATFTETNANWLARLHPDDLESTSKAYRDYINGVTDNYEIEFRQKTKDSNWKWILSHGKIVEYDVDGKPLRMLGTHTDITERKKAEEQLFQSEKKYRLLFYDNPLPMWMTTIPGLDIIDVNEAAIKHYGYSREEFLKLNTRDLRPAEDIAFFLSEVNKMEPGMINIRNWRHQKKDGTIIQVETYSHEIMYEGKRAWLGLSHDVTEKYESKELLQKSYEDIRQLASNLQSIREDERTNIAREIHDELGQQLTGLKMDLHWIARKINSTDGEIAGKVKESIELINATIASVRKISTDLRPSILDDLGLLPALEWQSEEFEKRSGTKVIFINKAGDITVQPHAATGIFRIYQELLTNIARHANASVVRTVLHKDENRLYFSISDNGVGFDLDTINNKKTLGLLGIKERTLLLDGTYEFKSKPGEGSVTTISIPVLLVKNSI